jgi:hypothetical protein
VQWSAVVNFVNVFRTAARLSFYIMCVSSKMGEMLVKLMICLLLPRETQKSVGYIISQLMVMSGGCLLTTYWTPHVSETIE